MKTILICLLICSFNVSAEGWFCQQQSAVRTNDGFRICGAGQDLMMEADARMMAMKNAIQLFQDLCEISSDCKKKDRIAIPGRTECTVTKWGGWKCVSLLDIALK